MSSLNLSPKIDAFHATYEEKHNNLIPFFTPNFKIPLSNSNKFAKSSYPIISKDDNRKPIRSRVRNSFLFKQKEFEKLVRQWKEETQGSSSVSKKLLNLAYLRIIAMGKIAVPLILKELKHSPDHWFVALKAITDVDPVNTGASFDQAVDYWLKWGQSQGLID